MNMFQIALFGYMFVIFSELPALADEAFLKEIEVIKTDKHLLLYFKVADCFNEDMKKAINNGINTTFNFFIRVYEVRRFWWDKKIADIEVKHDVQYDSFKRVYMVRLSEEGEKTANLQNLDEVKKLMTEIVALKVAELQDFRIGHSYQVCMMAELDKIRLPLSLHNVFFFLSLWDFETDWYTLDFTY